jgi:hypothetical protein
LKQPVQLNNFILDFYCSHSIHTSVTQIMTRVMLKIKFTLNLNKGGGGVLRVEPQK